MADQVVEMEYDVIKKTAADFQEDADLCRMIAKILDKVVQALKASFVGAIFFAQLIKWLEGISKALEELAKVQEEFNKDLLFAVERHEQGDFEGMNRFGEGVK